MAMINRQLLLARRPEGLVNELTIEQAEREPPELADGQALVRTELLSIDPTIRTWVDDNVAGYLPPIAIGGVVRASRDTQGKQRLDGARHPAGSRCIDELDGAVRSRRLVTLHRALYCGGMRKTSVYLDDQLAERLARLARQEGRSQAEVLREAIAAYEPAPVRDRNFALAAGFRRIDGDPRAISQIPESDLLDGFGA